MRSNYNLNGNSRDRGNPYANELYVRRKSSVDDLFYYQNRLGPRLSALLLSDDASNPDQLQRRLRILSSFLLGTSIFFWTWAVYNTHHLRKGNPNGLALDLGIFSFCGTALSSLLLLRLALGGSLLVCFKKGTQSEEEDELKFMNSKRNSGEEGHAPPGSCIRIFAALVRKKLISEVLAYFDHYHIFLHLILMFMSSQTHLIVVANYLLGLLFAMTAGKHIYIYFASYCFTFSILWLITAMACWVLLGAYREAIRITYGDEFVNKTSKNRFGCISLCNCLLSYCTRRLSTGRQNLGTNTNDEDGLDEDEEDDDIDPELRALYEGPGKRGYVNNNY
ncbi:hypothetical protein HJC23_007609 [Cyclotella cryptica]|uniref:Uncharacterized protein n=1 Tax=Cyclotella cryptica TaxID=29204 RepID=A0ABD3QRI4_9STRA